MNIKLKQITLNNFKGFKSKKLNFTDTTFIFGDNATGKTTILDSFLWLLFGKDSDGRSDFGVKYKDATGKTIPMQEVEVSAIVSIDGIDSEFKRVLREKWVKKRGSENSEFQGNETIFFIDDLPLKSSEYQLRISQIIDEDLFKLITTPTAFNSLTWTDRRSTLISIVGGVDSDSVIEEMKIDSDKKQELLNMLAKDSQIDNHKKTLASKIKKAKDELKMIPTRIDEVLRSIPERLDFDSLRLELKQKESELGQIDAIISNESKAIDSDVAELSRLKNKKYSLESDLENKKRELKSQASKQVSEKFGNFDSLRNKKAQLESKLSRLNKSFEELNADSDRKRNEWREVNDSTFEMPFDKSTCPTCLRPFEEHTIRNNRESLEGNFNEQKAKKLESISAVGRALKAERENVEEKISALKVDLKQCEIEIEKYSKIDLREEIQKIYDNLLSDYHENDSPLPRIEQLQKDINEKESSIGKVDPSLKEKKSLLNDEINDLKYQLIIEDRIKKSNERVDELKSDEKSISQSISNLERTLNIVDSFNNSLINSIESKVNQLFKNVKFKMFEEQINGGIKETCICTVSGVDYSDLNTAMKINAGLEIINVLNRFYEVSAPIFIDNRESVVELIEVDAQIINLVVSEGDSQIRVS